MGEMQNNTGMYKKHGGKQCALLFSGVMRKRRVLDMSKMAT
jgi:hypothetical protein